MKSRTKLLCLAAFLVIALPLVLTGNAGAGYFQDGAVQNGVTGGWVVPNDMICIVGVHADGTLDIADGVTNARDCIYLNKGTMNGGTPFDLTTMTTNAQCTTAGGAGNDGAKHSWATSICVDGSGNGISLKDLDRTSQMCTAKGGTWVTSGKCVAYGRQFAGQDANGVPLPGFSNPVFPSGPTKGTSQADAGFCYARMRMTAAYGSQGACPSSSSNSSTAYDWAWNTTSNQCTYAKSIKGILDLDLTKANGTKYTAGTFLDLSAFTTMGDCLANGGSWANWIGQPTSTTSVATTPASTIPVWDYTRQTPDADNGCLHCHSSLTQYNGPAERWVKDSYLKQGHRNMLRKVTPGKNWAGPNEHGELELYTSAATGPLDFSAGTAKISGVDRPLLYIFGDWMAPAPAGLDVIVDMGGATGAKYNGSSNYSCAACHSTGWSNATNGLCSLSSKTSSGACTGAGGTWYPMIGVQGIGTPGYTPAEPAASFPGVPFTGAGMWNNDGIQCSRCHNATSPVVTATQIAASQFPSTHATGGGMGNLADGVGRTNLCFGCHQSIAKTNNGVGADADLSHPENIPVKNAATAPDYLPEFNGHVIGNSFLNSPHARYTGNIVPNALGKYDLEDTEIVDSSANNGGPTATAKYNSQFQGYTCWQSATSNSPAITMIVNGEIKEIKTKTDCENLYGAGAWRAGMLVGGVLQGQGTCVTCHDVHNSLFVEETRERALRKVCTDCHEKPFSNINHIDGPGTPLGYLAGTPEAWEACVTCHMPRATSGGFPMHLWRVNTDVNYRTFPTAAEFLNNTKKIANASPDGAYTNAVWVDVDYVCGQCHGGSFGANATQNSAPYFTKAELAQYAAGMHGGGALTASFTSVVSGKTVTLKDTSSSKFTPNLPINPLAITVNWGDRTTSTGKSGDEFPHTYTRGKKFQIVYTVTDSNGGKASKKVTLTPTYSITANISPALSSAATFTLMKNGSVIGTGTGTTSYVFSGLAPGTYQVKVEDPDCTFDGDGRRRGNQNPMSVNIRSSDMTTTFTHTP